MGDDTVNEYRFNRRFQTKSTTQKYDFEPEKLFRMIIV